MTASEARDALIGASEGSFLVRDSSHPLYLFTLSVQTWRGPTNVRVEYDSGRFCLDSTFPARSSLLSFSALPSLMQHYTSMSQEEERIAEEHHMVSKDNGILLKLRKPLYRPHAFPTLQHLTRLAINSYTDCHTQLPLPRPLMLYLHEYPFQVWGHLRGYWCISGGSFLQSQKWFSQNVQILLSGRIMGTFILITCQSRCANKQGLFYVRFLIYICKY